MDMKALLDEIIETNYKADFFFFKKPVRAKPRKPARDADLERLDAFLASRRYKSFDKFLAEYLATLKKTIRSEEKDRKKLKP